MPMKACFTQQVKRVNCVTNYQETLEYKVQTSRNFILKGTEQKCQGIEYSLSLLPPVCLQTFFSETESDYGSGLSIR